ncbi:hypothetical protein Tco_1353664 [Tanacetum coccineum]
MCLSLKPLITLLKHLLFSSPMFQQLLIHLLELTKKPTSTTKQESKKSPSEILKIKKEQAETLIEDENAMDKGVADIVKDYKRKHDDDEDPPAGPNQGVRNDKK